MEAGEEGMHGERLLNPLNQGVHVQHTCIATYEYVGSGDIFAGIGNLILGAEVLFIAPGHYLESDIDDTIQ